MSRAGTGEGCSAEQQPHQEQGGSADQPAHGDGSADEPVPDRPRRRRHRRVVSPPTNPSADGADDTVTPADGDPGPPGESARDAWIRAQRPPHWG